MKGGQRLETSGQPHSRHMMALSMKREERHHQYGGKCVPHQHPIVFRLKVAVGVVGQYMLRVVDL